jgi:hypothetical protein
VSSLKGSELLERIVVLEQSTKAAHKRIDDRDRDIKEIKDGVAAVGKDVKEVVAWMNRGKGWAAAALLMAGVLGSVFTKLAALFSPSGKT